MTMKVRTHYSSIARVVYEFNQYDIRDALMEKAGIKIERGKRIEFELTDLDDSDTIGARLTIVHEQPKQPDTLPEDELFCQMEKLLAYDLGATDAGNNDPDLRQTVVEQLRAMDETARTRWISLVAARYYLSDQGMAQGYTIEDVLEMMQWVEAQTGA